MPISPSQALSSVRDTRVTDAIIKIDGKLSDPDWVKDWQYGGIDNPHWKFIISGEFSDVEKLTIQNTYLNVGWSKVDCLNSSEIGKRPGLCCVTLFK